MTLKEKKRKLSEILGINVFESRYKGIDAILENEGAETESPNNAEAKVKEEKTAEEKDELKAKEPDTAQEKDAEFKTEQFADELPEKNDGEAESSVESEANANDESGEPECTEVETETQSAESELQANEPECAEAEMENTEKLKAELFDAKLEAKLLRVSVREDKLESAKKLFKADYGIEEIDKVEKWIKNYPEWTKQKSKEQAKSFGMGVGDNESGDSAEEKRLRELGIN